MIIMTCAFLALLLSFSIEFVCKARWLKPILNVAVIVAFSIVVFRFSLKVGSKVERYNNAGIVADTLQYFEESTRSNSLAEVHAKLMVLRQELPKAITSGEPTTSALLEVLRGQPSTNNVTEGGGRQ